MIGVGQRVGGDVPRRVPLHAVKIDENTHQFGDGETGVSIVELHGGLRGQRGQ